MPDDRLTSLLACLNKLPGSLHLDCPLISDDQTVLEKTPFPFVTVTDTDPCARLLEGRILTEAGSLLKEVFLLVQRDRYFLRHDPLRPVTNRDMESAWRKTFQAYEQDGNYPPIHVVRPGAGPLPPLFYCTRTRIFFPPPCPRCASALGQCEDDDLLTALGLAPYGRSLKRYLYCPACSKTGVPVFYAFEQEASDPPAVRDRFALIGDFVQVRGQEAGRGSLPCPACPEHASCYGPGASALTRIVPFSFYPFHLVVLGAPHLNGLDFLTLAAGASFAEMGKELERRGEGWRKGAVARLEQRCGERLPHVAPEPGRRFFEVLYLKLSFLGDVCDHLPSLQEPFGGSERGFAADRVWVTHGEAGALLPFLWNFRTRFVGLRDDPSEGSAFPGLPASNEFVSLGLLWFLVLLANARQDMIMVSQCLKEAVRDRTLAEAMPTEDPFSGETNPFSPANVFWQPGEITCDRTWRDLWERSLGLGWSLLRAGVSWDDQWLAKGFRQQLESLREDAKTALLQPMPAVAEAARGPEPAVAAETISSVLLRIAGKWRAGLEAEKAEMAETVILSTMVLSSSPAEAQPEAAHAGESMAETVMLGPGGAVHRGKQDTAPRRQPEEAHAPFVEETVSRAPEPAASAGPRAEDVLAETVIISRGARPQRQAEPAAGGDEAGKEEGTAAEHGTEGPKKPSKKASADDDLAQTVIIDPAKLRPRK